MHSRNCILLTRTHLAPPFPRPGHPKMSRWPLLPNRIRDNLPSPRNLLLAAVLFIAYTSCPKGFLALFVR